MEFFRKVYSNISQFANEVDVDLCSLGFVSATDGSDFPSETFNERWLKWKGETLLTSDDYTYLKFLQPNNRAEAGSIYFSLYGSSNPTFFIRQGPGSMFFIPLINNSFFLKVRPDELTTSIPYFPSLLDLVPQTEHYLDRIWMYVGLLTNISDYNPYTYLYYGGNGIRNSNNTLFQMITGRNEQFVPEGVDTPYRYGSIPNNPECAWWDLESVSVSSGTCVLAKVPYTNKYIDGLYYIVVSPQESVDSRFFSFGGRNFMGIGRNLVVELPVN